MKRDFREEYNNYIESDMPDLWSRIEPNLKEKVPVSQVDEIATTTDIVIRPENVQNIEEVKNRSKKQKQNKAKIYRFIKVATPVAAGICLLVIGVGVMSISQKSMEAAPEADASASEYECTEEFAAEESYDYMEENAEVEESYEYEEEAVAEALMEEEFVEDYASAEEDSIEWAEDSVVNNSIVLEDSQATTQSDSVATESTGEEHLREEEKEIAGAILLRIAKASQSEKEVGFAYIYVFRLEDGSNLEVYVTDELCGEWEETDSKLQRQKNYLLTLEVVSDSMKKEGDFSAEYVLQEAVELP